VERIIEIPKGVTVKMNGFDFEAQGPKGKVNKIFRNEYVSMEMKDRKIRIFTKREKKTDLAVVGTWESIVNSSFIGVTKGFIYTMKIVYAHFPVKVTVKGNEVHLDNFLGEKSPRKITLGPETKVTVKGDLVTVEGTDLEATGNAAARIERMSRIKGFDPRVFQDGIYIVRKGDVIET
jgi:large subunit ribosomal protein L6